VLTIHQDGKCGKKCEIMKKKREKEKFLVDIYVETIYYGPIVFYKPFQYGLLEMIQKKKEVNRNDEG
jgi:hypothetical protein